VRKTAEFLNGFNQLHMIRKIFLKNGIALGTVIAFQKPNRSPTKAKEMGLSLQGKQGSTMASLQVISEECDS